MHQPTGRGQLSRRCQRCLDLAITAMIDQDYAGAEGHLEAIGDSGAWDHHDLNLALR